MVSVISLIQTSFITAIAPRAFFTVIMGYKRLFIDVANKSSHKRAQECPSGYHRDYTVQCLPVCCLKQTCRQRRTGSGTKTEHRGRPSFCTQISTQYTEMHMDREAW